MGQIIIAVDIANTQELLERQIGFVAREFLTDIWGRETEVLLECKIERQ